MAMLRAVITAAQLAVSKSIRQPAAVQRARMPGACCGRRSSMGVPVGGDITTVVLTSSLAFVSVPWSAEDHPSLQIGG